MSETRSRYGQTVYLKGSRAVPLRRRRLDREPGEGGYDEAWLQQLLYRTPEILPIGEIDPAFAPGVPLCRELPTDAGPIDVAYVSEQGLLSIVECKLWRNPEARRDAVTQILDYAKEISHWSYDELNDAVCRANKSPRTPNALFDLVRQQNDTIDEADFVDDVTRSLQSGRFLLLVVGDGIREGVERIADYLKQSAGIRFTFGLVELAIFDMPDHSGGGVIVEPRILAKTFSIERAVVRAADAGVVVEDPPPDLTGETRGRPRITEAEFYREIERVDAGLSARLRGFFGRYTALGEASGERLEVTLSRRSYILHWHRSSGQKVNFGTLFPDGDLNTNYVVWNAEESGDPQVGVDYLEALAKLVPKAVVRKDGNYWSWRVVVHGRRPKIADLLDRMDEWLSAIQRAVIGFNQLDDD